MPAILYELPAYFYSMFSWDKGNCFKNIFQLFGFFIREDTP